ncbi:MAG: hypothetical protein Greene041619_1228 [Candidatus Peregrinibacteria bacterium Greene0416_19]|nr:MAG: hypothetical protein Greene041619_1228 [Candidatus Peregrinibacteria bacterium Greene0416_19]
MRHLYVAIQGNTIQNGSPAPTNAPIHEAVTNVTLKNVLTGRGYDAVRLTGADDFGQSTSGIGTYQIYRIENVPVLDPQVFQLLADFADNGSGKSPMDGDMFKALICTSAAGTASTCSFGGMIKESTAYNLRAESKDGTPITDVRPGRTVTGNTHRIANATLTIAVKAIGTLDTAVKNSKNKNLLRFEARAGETRDILLTKTTFNAAAGSLLNGQNYTLWVDTDANSTVDTIVGKGVASQGGQITFNKLTGGGFVVPKMKTVAFEVHTDIAASLANDSLQLQFASADSSYIEAEDVVRGASLAGIKTNGICAVASCDITVTTVPSILYKLVSQGDLYVTKDTVTNRSHQCLNGTLCDTILRLQLHAENEDIDVTDIQLTSRTNTASSVDRLELWKDGATSSFATATVGGCGSDQVPGPGTFCAKMQSQQLVIPKGQDVKVLVKPRLKSDIEGAVSGEFLRFYISRIPASNNATGAGAVRARGAMSSNNLSANNENGVPEGEVIIGNSSAGANADIVGEKNVAVSAKLTSITNASLDPNGTAVPTGISSIGQFRFTAAPNSNSKNGLNKVVIDYLFFNVQSSNVLFADSFTLWNKTNPTVKATCTPVPLGSITPLQGDISGDFRILCQSLSSGAVNTTIDQGTDAVFVIEGTIKNAGINSAADSTAMVFFQAFNLEPDAPGSRNLGWADRDSATAQAFDWMEATESPVYSTFYGS